MSIKLEYIVCNRKDEELKRFDSKTEAEAYDSVICAAEDISQLLSPLQKELSLNDEQLFSISEHLAFKSDEVKLALKQIKKPKAPATLISKEDKEKSVASKEDTASTNKSSK